MRKSIRAGILIIIAILVLLYAAVIWRNALLRHTIKYAALSQGYNLDSGDIKEFDHDSLDLKNIALSKLKTKQNQLSNTKLASLHIPSIHAEYNLATLPQEQRLSKLVINQPKLNVTIDTPKATGKKIASKPLDITTFKIDSYIPDVFNELKIQNAMLRLLLPKHTVEMKFSASMQRLQQQRHLVLHGELNLAPNLEMPFSITGNLNKQNRKGELTTKINFSLQNKSINLREYISQLSQPTTLSNGQVLCDINSDITNNHLSGSQANCSIKNTDMNYGRNLSLGSIHSRFTLITKWHAAIRQAKLNVKQFSAKFAGGTIKLEPFTLPIKELKGTKVSLVASNQQTKPVEIQVHFKDIDMAKLVKILAIPDIKAEGKLTGTVPISIKNGNITLKTGNLSSSSQGVIQYVPAEKPSFAATNDSTKLLFEALENFHYEKIIIEMNMNAVGQHKQQVSVRLTGRNPALAKRIGNTPIQLNITFKANFWDLIKDGLITWDLQSRLQDRMEKTLALS